MVLLYEHPLSPYAQKVKIALAEKGIAFECRLPDFMSGRDDAFAAANPRLEVPALVDGDTRVFDSTIILEYIEDRWPTPPLLPAAPAEQAAGVHRYLERQLGDRPWFNGAAFGWGDLAVVPYVQGLAATGHPPAGGMRLAAWLARGGARPSVAAAFAAAAESMEGFEMLPQLVESGFFKREYRDHRLEWMIRSGGIDIVLDGMRQ